MDFCRTVSVTWNQMVFVVFFGSNRSWRQGIQKKSTNGKKKSTITHTHSDPTQNNPKAKHFNSITRFFSRFLALSFSSSFPFHFQPLNKFVLCTKVTITNVTEVRQNINNKMVNDFQAATNIETKAKQRNSFIRSLPRKRSLLLSPERYEIFILNFRYFFVEKAVAAEKKITRKQLDIEQKWQRQNVEAKQKKKVHGSQDGWPV